MRFLTAEEDLPERVAEGAQAPSLCGFVVEIAAKSDIRHENRQKVVLNLTKGR